MQPLSFEMLLELCGDGCGEDFCKVAGECVADHVADVFHVLAVEDVVVGEGLDACGLAHGYRAQL